MAQVTYRGVKYDTNDNKQAKAQKVTLTYRGVKSEKELAAAQSLTFKQKQGEPCFLVGRNTQAIIFVSMCIE